MGPIAPLLFLAVAIAWVCSEYGDRRWLRISLGICLFACAYTTSHLWLSLRLMGQNSRHTTAAARLVESTISELESGNTERVLSELTELRRNTRVTYENDGGFYAGIRDYVIALGYDASEFGIESTALSKDENKQAEVFED